MDGIVQNELFIGTELGIVSGFELSVLHMVIFHAHESSIIVCLWVAVTSVKYLSVRFMAENAVCDIDGLKQFDRLGYIFDADTSSDEIFVFIKQ